MSSPYWNLSTQSRSGGRRLHLANCHVEDHDRLQSLLPLKPKGSEPPPDSSRIDGSSPTASHALRPIDLNWQLLLDWILANDWQTLSARWRLSFHPTCARLVFRMRGVRKGFLPASQGNSSPAKGSASGLAASHVSKFTRSPRACRSRK